MQRYGRFFTGLILLSGCFPTPSHECETEGGMYVTGAECDEELSAFQRRIEDEAMTVPGLLGRTLGKVSLRVRSKDLNEKAGFQGPGGYSVAGLTHCTGPMMIVARPDGKRWEETSLAHEAFHIFQGCPFDETIYKECFTRFDHSSPSIRATCEFEANHPTWTTEVYPVLIRINEVR